MIFKEWLSFKLIVLMMLIYIVIFGRVKIYKMILK